MPIYKSEKKISEQSLGDVIADMGKPWRNEIDDRHWTILEGCDDPECECTGHLSLPLRDKSL